MTARRFPPPMDGRRHRGMLIVRDHKGQALAYVSFKDEPGVVNLLTRDEARRIAANIAKLPDLRR
jgi:hypothetical protein